MLLFPQSVCSSLVSVQSGITRAVILRALFHKVFAVNFASVSQTAAWDLRKCSSGFVLLAQTALCPCLGLPHWSPWEDTPAQIICSFITQFSTVILKHMDQNQHTTHKCTCIIVRFISIAVRKSRRDLWRKINHKPSCCKTLCNEK